MLSTTSLLHSPALPRAGLADASSAARGSAAPTSWLEGLDGSTSLSLRAEVPPEARGLSAQAHAQRVLEALLSV